jgi:ribonucleotide reductase alpha subunit
LAGEFVCVNPHLVRELISLNLWNDDVRNQLVADNGSVQKIKAIPQNVKDMFKTVWEIPQKQLINLARARAPFICQSQSLNIYMAEPSYNKLTSSHFHSWSLGLKTGQYYLRSRPARDAIKFTLNVESLLKTSADTGLFQHMNTNNLTQAELDQMKRKKRKIAEVSKVSTAPAVN